MIKDVVGMIFESPAQLKESMIDYGISNGYQLEFPVNDYKRLLVRCGKEETIVENDEGVVNKKTRKCPFRLWASRNTSADDIKSLPPKERQMPGRPTIKGKRGACEKEIKLFLAPKTAFLLSKTNNFLQKTDLQQIRQEEYSRRSRKLFLIHSRREGYGSRRKKKARAAARAKLSFSRSEASRRLGFDP
ncbi:hypothetical protein OSB04_012470 [Centaurea solstitialis]|uniref:Uncharacterized protein n=1 Tax=Centaurea solstitialis TaxID=347529 RepID=A0AA38WQN9_9ASTR|nr:hypothetical protein OSB04_012470 [Centaurea solstitialis]